MTVDGLIAAFEAYYGDKYPEVVKMAFRSRYGKGVWGPKGLKALYELALLKHSRQFRIAPDLAVLGPLEEAALDQRDLELLERKPIPGQILLDGPNAEQIMERNREAVAEMLGAMMTARGWGKPKQATSPD